MSDDDIPFDESNLTSARTKFFNESVSTTSIFLAKVSNIVYPEILWKNTFPNFTKRYYNVVIILKFQVTVNSILSNVSLAEALENAASSKYQCPVQ